MKKILAAALLGLLMLPRVADAEGFGVVEWTTEGVAMAGARMFAEDDPGSVAYNPASITKIQGEAIKNSYTYMSPTGNYDLFDASGNKIESGQNTKHFAWVPGSYYVKQMNEKDWFGIGAFPRFAMISQFSRNSKVASNAFYSRLKGLSITPVYAHKFDKKWSASVGAEISYIGLELQRQSYSSTYGMNLGSTKTDGHSYAMGWNAAANYAFDENNEIGMLYRSRITHSMDGHFKMHPITGGTITADAYGAVTFPDSWAFGFNHKFNKCTRIELNATRTNWGTYDALNITLTNPSMAGVLPSNVDSDKNYKDGWRYAIGLEHKLSEKYSIMCGFAYDESSIPYDGGDFYVPTGDRRTYTIGFGYNDGKQTFAMAFGYMDIGGIKFAGHSSDAYAYANTHDNSCKIFSIGYGRHF